MIRVGLSLAGGSPEEDYCDVDTADGAVRLRVGLDVGVMTPREARLVAEALKFAAQEAEQ